MKPVKYHPLAESELVGSAAFYEDRRPFLGDGFLDSIDETLAKIRSADVGRRRPEAGKSDGFLSEFFIWTSRTAFGSLQLHI